VARPELSLKDLLEIVPHGTFSPEVIESVEIGIKYAGYIEREKQQAEKNNRLEYIRIPADFDFDKVQSLSIECRQKLKRYRPSTIAQASRISGISPADISVLLVYFGR
jgi:tRNA uridine 5-carboxymethylaminomethyl modification enzyme